MTFRHTFGVALLAIAASSATAARELHNLVLLIPESLPAASVEEKSAPTLARLKAQGVHFINSHSGFPGPVLEGETAAAADLQAPQLTAAAAASYSTLLIEDGNVEIASRGITRQTSLPAGGFAAVLHEALPAFKAASQPFLIIYRFSEREEGAHAALAGLGAKVDAHATGAGLGSKVDAHGTGAGLGSNDVGAYGHRKPDAMLRASDQALLALEAALRSQGVYETTNIVVAAERGRSTALKHSQTSLSLGITYPTGMSGALPPGFLAIDLMHALQAEDATLSLFDPDGGNRRLDWKAGQYPIEANAVIAVDGAHPLVEIESHGGHDLIYFAEYLSAREVGRLAQIIIETVLEQDYVSGLFVDEKRLGRVRGALSLRHIGWTKSAGSRMPAMAVGFISYGMDCSQPTTCGATIADSPFGEGQPVRGAFSRADTWNFMAARGPDFRSAVTSRAPASNADVARTIAELLQIGVNGNRVRSGRVLLEALRGYERGGVPTIRREVIASKPSLDGSITEVHVQLVGPMKYFDAAGFPGLTMGVPPRAEVFDEPPRWWRWKLPKPKAFTIEITGD